MLIKLRRRFIIITMSLVGLVLLIVLATSVVASYQTSINRVSTAVSESLSNESAATFIPWIGNDGVVVDGERPGYSVSPKAPPEDLPDGQAGSEDRMRRNGGQFVAVYVATINDASNQVITDNSSFVNIDPALLSRALEDITTKMGAAKSSNDTEQQISGHLLDLNLIYSATTSSDGKMQIALGDTSSIISDSLQRLGVSTLIWLGAMVLFFFISLLLSKIALRPVAEAWNKQRQFVSDASHELKTPLTVILANSSLLQAHPDKTIGEQMHWIKNTEAEAMRMDDLVRNLLLLAQTDEEERAVMSEVVATVDLSALVEQNILQFETVLFERNIELISDIDPNILVLGRDAQLSRLLYILLDNASKYALADATTRAHVKVSLKSGIGAKRGKARKQHAVLTIANSGEPLDQSALPHLFERFYRGDQSHSSTEGAGLGLSLAKAIVEAHKGEVSVSSDAEHGTIFTVTL